MGNIDWEKLKGKIKRHAFTIGIDKIGFTDAQLLSERLPRLLKQAGDSYVHAINLGDHAARVNPSALLPGARSVISIAVAYPPENKMLPPNDGRSRGRVSAISRGTDYHVVVKSRLEQLKAFILNQHLETRVVMTADKEPILEKALAVKAGLGWFGRNTLLITPEFGSWVCLGELITDLPLPPDTPMENCCGTCRCCIDACPTGALDEGLNLNPDRCLACLTLGKSWPAPETRVLFGNHIYGCDICQQACPHNSKVKAVYPREFDADAEDAFPLLTDLLTMTNARFKQRFGSTSGAWRGRKSWQHNAVIAAGNLGDDRLVPELVQMATADPRSKIRALAAWAIGRTASPGGIEPLKQALETEKDPLVLTEIADALRNCKG